MGERKGGRGEEGEARQSGFKFRHKSKQILSFPECWAHETTSSKLCCCAQTWGHRMCIFSLPFYLPFVFLAPHLSFSFSFFPLFSPLPRFASIFLYLLLLLASAPPHTPLGLPPCPLFSLQACRVSSSLFMIFFSCNSSFLSSFTRFCNFLQSRLSSEWLEGQKRSRKQLVIAFAQNIRLWCPGPRLGLPGTVSAVLMCSWAIPRETRASLGKMRHKCWQKQRVPRQGVTG